MNIDQRALLFACGDQHLVGVIDVPERPLARGVVLLADADHYRIGARRHGTLLSRSLAGRGYPTLRFDRRGTGDADGVAGSLDDAGADVAAAVKEAFMQMPELQDIVLWSFGASAASALVHAHDDRVRALVLLNPRLPEPEGAALCPRIAASLACFNGAVLILTGGADPRVEPFLALLARHRLACQHVDLLPATWREDAANVAAGWLASW